MRKGLVAGLAVLVAASIQPQIAEAQLRPFQISIAGGPSFAMGDFKDFVDTGYHVQGSVGFDAPLFPLGLRADLFWQELPDVEDEWFRQIGGHLNGVFEIPLVVIQPYALVGAGVLRTDGPDEVHTGHTHLGESETTVGFNAGAGLEFPFAGLGGFIEARYLNIFGSGSASDFRSVPVTIGVRF